MLGQIGEFMKSLLQTSKAVSFSILWDTHMLKQTALCFSEDAYKTQVRIDDEPAYLDILDTAGQVSNFPMRVIQSELNSKILTSGMWVTVLKVPYWSIKEAVAE